MKHIIIACDGTWQRLAQPHATNVAHLVRAVAPTARTPAGPVPQLVYYDEGLGLSPGPFSPWARLQGGGFGAGLDAKIADAYAFLALNYEPGDALFLFGFSRGAYTVRSLVGLLRCCGVLRRDCAELTDVALAHYRRGRSIAAAAFRENHSHPAGPAGAPLVRYLGVWDTVGTLGVPQRLPCADRLNRRYRFHDTCLSQDVGAARHAVAIDEARLAFAPTLWTNVDQLNAAGGDVLEPYERRAYQQQWFPGDHGSVGGGGGEPGLAMGTLLWVMDGASEAGLALDSRTIEIYAAQADPLACWRPAWDWATLATQVDGVRPRRGPRDAREVSQAARRRWRALPSYRPPALAGVAPALDRFHPAGDAG